MGKHAETTYNFCPGCIDENNTDELPQNSELSCDESDCCCSCCCSCESSGQDIAEERRMQTFTDPNAYKKDFLSYLYRMRANGQPDSIQNVLQYIEALTQSHNLLDPYHPLENFCIDCLTEPVCDCYMRSISNAGLRNSCTCSACTIDEQEDTQECISGHENCPDCISTRKTSFSGNPMSRRVQRRRRNRRQRRRYNQRQFLMATNQHQRQPAELCKDPKCSGDSHGCETSENIQMSGINDDQICNCQQCNVEVPSRRNPTCTCIVPRLSRFRDRNNSQMCIDGSPIPQDVADYQTCEFSDCDECRRSSSDSAVNVNESCSDDNCETCIRLQSMTLDCNCGIFSQQNQRKTEKPTKDDNFKDPKRSSKSKSSSGINDTPNDQQVTDESCDCEECQKSSDYSEDSCEECYNDFSKSRKTGKKR